MGKLYRIDGKNRITLSTEILSELKSKPGDYVILKKVNSKIQIVKVSVTEA